MGFDAKRGHGGVRRRDCFLVATSSGTNAREKARGKEGGTVSENTAFPMEEEDKKNINLDVSCKNDYQVGRGKC